MQFLSANQFPKPTKIFEFILDCLSQPRYSSIIAWEGTGSQFTIIQPDQIARLWGNRNGRPNMTYQNFTRALRYYYPKKVLTKVRGRKYRYRFHIRELDRQYGYQTIAFSRATSERGGNNHSKTDYEFPATRDTSNQPISDPGFPATYSNFSMISSLVFLVPHALQNTRSPSSSNGNYFPVSF